MRPVTTGEFLETIVPAAPGFKLHYIMDDKPRIHGPAEMIVAWHVQVLPRGGASDEPKTITYPVTVAGELCAQGYAIEQPDGTVVFPNDHVAASLDEAKRYVDAFPLADAA